jgi:hypothetical protein
VREPLAGQKRAQKVKGCAGGRRRAYERYQWKARAEAWDAVMLEELAGESPEMEAFLRDQTNARAILAGNIHTPQEFGRCYYAEVFKIVRANGDVRPCCIRVLEPDLWLGNILTDSLESIACRTMVVADRSLPFCSPRYCRMGGVNRLVERGLRGEIQPPISPQVVADPMF